MKSAARLVAVALAMSGCGAADPEGTDLEQTCAAVREAFPPTLYDDAANAAFARELGTIVEGAEPAAAKVFDALATSIGVVVAAAGDNTAVVTANVGVLAALEDVNAACIDAGAKAVH